MDKVQEIPLSQRVDDNEINSFCQVVVGGGVFLKTVSIWGPSSLNHHGKLQKPKVMQGKGGEKYMSCRADKVIITCLHTGITYIMLMVKRIESTVR